MENQVSKIDIYKASRILYILEASLEYFISILISGAYLAKLTSSIGLSDGLTGILTSFISLGCGFQIIAIFLANKKPVKKWITILHTINQLFFALIYFVPFIKISKIAKSVLFILFLLLGHVINNIVNSPKINWFMALVDDKKRGGFTAKKEMASLICGMAFSYLMSYIIDLCELKGNVKLSFIICGATILLLTISHSLTLIFSKEKTEEKTIQKISFKESILSLFKNKRIVKVVILAVLWKMTLYTSISFYGSYQIKELGFSMTYVSILSIIYAVVRSVFSPLMGKIADKKNFSYMLNICYIIAGLGFFINIFTVPQNGHLFYTIYYVLYAISMAGINSGEINLIYDEVEHKDRMSAYAIEHSISGVIGFLTTVVVTFLVNHIQSNNNTFLGMNVYAQQVVSAISFVGVIVIVIYLNLFIKRKPNK